MNKTWRHFFVWVFLMTVISFAGLADKSPVKCSDSHQDKTNVIDNQKSKKSTCELTDENRLDKPFYPPAPGHENLPVIFWAHFMPQVATGLLHSGGHVGGNADIFPFMKQQENRVEETMEHMKKALDSGINGFQFLTVVFPEYVEAAERLKKETGQMFYVAPEWCGLGDDVEKAAEKIAAFAKKYKDNPHIMKINGRQLHFTYNHGKWAGRTWWDSDHVPQSQKILKDKGVEVMIVPTIGDLEAVLLDRLDLIHKTKPAFTPTKPGELKWMKETHWDGGTGLNSGANMKSSAIRVIRKRLGQLDRDFLFVPALRTMYDSSNRLWQAIHCRGQGVRMLRRDLKRWTQAGFRQFTFSTWNDVNETMLMPSSRNAWGYNDLINYYHALAATGKSPFKKPHFVISYEPEIILGDQGYFQCLLLPETATVGCDFAFNVRFKNLAGEEVYSFGNLLQANNEWEDDLEESRFDTSWIKDEFKILTPYVTIDQIDSRSGERLALYKDIRLPPIRIRYNKLHFYTPYSISLNHIDTNVELSLRLEPGDKIFTKDKQGEFATIEADIKKMDGTIARLNLSESCLPIGAFRTDDTIATAGGEQRRLYVRFTSSNGVKARVKLSEGVINESYSPHWNLKKALALVNKPETTINIPSWNKTTLPIVCRVLCPLDAELELYRLDETEPFLKTTMEELAKKPIYVENGSGERKTVILVQLTTDVTDQNIDYPIRKTGTYVRTIPLLDGSTPLRAFHSWALMENQMIAYSNPVAILVEKEGSEDLTKKRPMNYIRTHGVFDDFVNDSSSSCRNPFTVDDVVTEELPLWMAPYFKLKCDEGVGIYLNHNGTGNQLGRAWLTGEYEWLKNGYKGSAINLKNGQIHFRSKTMPHGSFTISMRIKPNQHRELETIIEDGDYYKEAYAGPIDLRFLKDGRLKAMRHTPGGEASIESKGKMKEDQWNHIVVSYDLKNIKLYLNGKLEGVAPVKVPTYQRTHSVPKIGFSQIIKNKSGRSVGFNGNIDQIEIIGTHLTDREVDNLYKKGEWRK